MGSLREIIFGGLSFPGVDDAKVQRQRADLEQHTQQVQRIQENNQFEKMIKKATDKTSKVFKAFIRSVGVGEFYISPNKPPTICIKHPLNYKDLIALNMNIETQTFTLVGANNLKKELSLGCSEQELATALGELWQASGYGYKV